MHILFLTDNFPPEVNAPASRTHEHCREWVKAGHDVTVVTCAPNFPVGRVFDGYRNRLWQEERIDGIRVVRVWSYITPNEGFLKRTLDYASFMVSATLAAPFVRKVDVVVATSPQFFTAVAGYMVSHLKRVPYVFELRDLWPESIRAVGALHNERVLRALERLELFLYRKAAHIVAVTEAFRENLISRGIASDKISIVTNGVDLSRFAPMPKDTDLLARLDLRGKFVAGYIGTHGMAHGLDALLDAADIIQRKDTEGRFRMLFLGDGAHKERLRQQAFDMRLNNVLFLDSVPKEEVVRYWSLLDVALVHLKKDYLFRTVIPSKIFECMGMGLPIILGVQGEAARIVEEAGAGLIVEPENPKEIASAILRLEQDDKLLRQLRKAARASAAVYDRKVLARRMLGILEQVVAEREQ